MYACMCGCAWGCAYGQAHGCVCVRVCLCECVSVHVRAICVRVRGGGRQCAQVCDCGCVWVCLHGSSHEQGHDVDRGTGHLRVTLVRLGRRVVRETEGGRERGATMVPLTQHGAWVGCVGVCGCGSVGLGLGGPTKHCPTLPQGKIYAAKGRG